MRRNVFLAVGLAVALVLAFFVAPHASSEPDGLEKVAEDEGFAEDAAPHALDDGPTGGLSTGVAGVVGVLVTFALGAGLFVVVRRR